MSDDLIERLNNPTWAEHDGQRLILHPETVQADMQAAAVQIRQLRDHIDLLRSNLAEMDALALK